MLRIEYTNANNIDDLVFQESWQGVEYLDTDITTITWELEKEILTDNQKVLLDKIFRLFQLHDTTSSIQKTAKQIH